MRPDPLDTTIKTQTARILLVDDDEGIRRMLRTFLQRLGYTVEIAVDGQDAADCMASQTFNLVISDMIMPNRSGLQLLAEVKREAPWLPVIIITGMPEVDAAVECMKHGAFDYITKPFDFEKIREVVKRALAQVMERPMGDRLQAVQSRFFGHYRIERVLGEGNVGVVFLAIKEDDPSRRLVALKVLKQGFVTPEERQHVISRFMAEAEITASFNHPNIISVIEYDMISEESLPYIVTEYFESKTLNDYISDPTLLDDLQKTWILRQVADALSVIHARQVYHRDIKPHNILVNDELEVRLMDFGVAKNPNASMTADNELIGSPAYIAPEGFGAAKVDHRADLFSLGVVAYELYLGVRPFSGESIPHFAHLIQYDRPVQPRKLRPDFPYDLQLILARLLKKDPDDRYDDASQLLQDLDTFLEYGNQHRQGLVQTITQRLRPDWK